MPAMGCEGGRAVSEPKSLSTKNAFQRPTVLSETSKPDSGSILGFQEKEKTAAGKRESVLKFESWLFPLTGPSEALDLGLPN